MTTKLEQAARQIIVDWDSGIHLYEAIAALRKALAEQAERRPQNCGTGYCSCIECQYEAKQAEQEPVAFADLYSVAGKLALELECLLLDTKDLSVVSKWWDSAHDALEQWRSIKDTAPVSAEAIRAEALEEVAKWLAESGLIGSNDCAAAIRGMK